MITLQLKIAFQQPGCPLCYLRNQTAQRYLRRFLWENVNWQYHEETMLPEERSSWIRVVAFFAGERSEEEA